MEYSRQEFEKILTGLLFEYDNWKKEKERTDLQINTTRKAFSSKILALIGASGEKSEKVIISGDFIIGNVHDNYIELELKSFGYYSYKSKYYRRQAEKLSKGDKINVTGIASGHYSDMESDNIRWFLDHSSEYLNKTETKGPLIVNLIDLKDSNACYIATVCYQSNNAKEVIILRQFRDSVLSSYYLGRLFIKIYYATSPTLAKHLAKTTTLKHFIKKCILNPLIYLIQKNAL